MSLHGNPFVRPADGRRRKRRSGLTLVELVIVLGVTTLAMGMFATTITAISRQRGINRENAIAAEAVRGILEEMRNQDFLSLYALYNRDPTDDPGGGAPGPNFAVEGLGAASDDPDGLVGEIFLPEHQVGTGPGGPVWEMREHASDPRLGLPRDLNADSVIDELDHSTDYVLLPVRVVATWEGRQGVRRLELVTMLVDWKAAKP